MLVASAHDQRALAAPFQTESREWPCVDLTLAAAPASGKHRAGHSSARTQLPRLRLGSERQTSPSAGHVSHVEVCRQPPPGSARRKLALRLGTLTAARRLCANS